MWNIERNCFGRGKNYSMVEHIASHLYKKKILIFINSTIGLYRFRKELISVLIAARCQVYVSSPNDGFLDELIFFNIKMICIALIIFYRQRHYMPINTK